MNPELMSKREFAARFEVRSVKGQFENHAAFDTTNVGTDARLVLAKMKPAELKQVAKFYGWVQGGNAFELFARLMWNWTVMRQIEVIGSQALSAWTNPELDRVLKRLGLTTIGNKPNKVTHLLNWQAKSRHDFRIALADKIQEYAAAQAIREKRDISVALMTDHRIESSIENYGYTRVGEIYHYVGKPVVFEVDDKPVSLETLNRIIADQERSIEGWGRAISLWETQLNKYLQESMDGTLNEDMNSLAARVHPECKPEWRWEFAARHIGTSFTALTNAMSTKHFHESRLRYLKGVRETKPKEQEPPMQGGLL